jgi:hypothetical protein
MLGVACLQRLYVLVKDLSLLFIDWMLMALVMSTMINASEVKVDPRVLRNTSVIA